VAIKAQRRVCVITGSRADYGVLYWLMREISDDPRLALQIIATGSHLAPEFGLTYKALESDGFRIDRRVEVLLSSDTAIGMSKAVGLGVIGFADALADLKPDIVVVLGDRFEILAAAQAAFLAGISLAHISGGELTEGAIDDVMRHCITKMSRYHFVATETYKTRVIQLGEPPDTVFNVGAPGLDNIIRLGLLDRQALADLLAIEPTEPFLLVTYHPVTAGSSDPRPGMQAMLDALDAFPGHTIAFTKPNADAGGRVLAAMIDAYAAAKPLRVKAFTSLGQQRYLSAMKHCAAVVGNSSSGIIEAPSMGKPTVNIGTRQHGRVKAASIIDCGESRSAIQAAIARAISQPFTAQAAETASLYGDGSASTQICKLLATLDVQRNFAKHFHDLPE
jgi:UDP-hydrolysing UDP-N-acetyl-D-glucosamine 2-epimerase